MKLTRKRTKTLGAPPAFKGRRTPGPHGKTLDMLAVKRPAPTFVHRFEAVGVKTTRTGTRFQRKAAWQPYVNLSKDRSLSGKARRNARREAVR